MVDAAVLLAHLQRQGVYPASYLDPHWPRLSLGCRSGEFCLILASFLQEFCC